ncbi:MAG: NAD(P)H-dependent oxidoreductase [Chloroflexia bacterium]|nr:NAD(P)H-dependent oxidoreductase [Chloroflexia bacterium]
MRLTVFNGSPRGRGSNTRAMLEHLLKGFDTVPGNSHEILYLKRVQETERLVQAFAEAESVLLAFPLYTDSMPGLAKAFIEALAPLCGREHNPPLAFMVQCGFPESAHCRYVERYLQKLARRLGSRYVGTIVKGGCEGVRLMPERMNRKLFARLEGIGRTLGQDGRLDPEQLRRLARPERYPAWSMPVFTLLIKTGLLSSYWDRQLKENGVYEQRFAQPYH